MSLSLASSEFAFSRASLGHARRFDALFQFADFVRRIVELAEFLLNGLHLLIQVVLALALFHLLLDAAADALLDLQHVHLAFDDGEHVFEALAHVGNFQHTLLLGKLQGHVRGDGIRQAAGLLDARQRGQDLGRHFLVEFYILLELGDHGTGQHVHLALFVTLDIRQRGDFRRKEFALHQFLDVGAFHAFHQYFHRAVRELEELQDGRHGADPVQILDLRIIDIGLLLRDQQDAFVGPSWPDRARRWISPARRTAGSPCGDTRRRPRSGRTGVPPAGGVNSGASIMGSSLTRLALWLWHVHPDHHVHAAAYGEFQVRLRDGLSP